MSVRWFFLIAFLFLLPVYLKRTSWDLNSLFAKNSEKKSGSAGKKSINEKEEASKEVEEYDQDKNRALDVEMSKQKESARKKYIPQVSKPGKDIKSKEKDTPSVSELKKKQMELVEKERQLLERENDIKKMEKEIIAKINKLEKIYREYKKSIEQEKKIKKKRLEKLVLMYSKMDVKRAGPAFERMDKGLAVQLLLHLKEKFVSKLFEKMNTDKVVEYSEALAKLKKKKGLKAISNIK